MWWSDVSFFLYVHLSSYKNRENSTATTSVADHFLVTNQYIRGYQHLLNNLFRDKLWDCCGKKLLLLDFVKMCIYLALLFSDLFLSYYRPKIVENINAVFRTVNFTNTLILIRPDMLKEIILLLTRLRRFGNLKSTLIN